MRIIRLLLFLFAFSSFAQNQGSEGIKTYLPNISPPSPNAYAFSEFGKNENNIYRGRVSSQIPLFEYSHGNLQLPITLNYNAAGVKVDDLPTWTGINWVMNYGGIITRNVVDNPDELIQREQIDLNDLINSTASNCAPNSQHYYDLVLTEETKDLENDIFSFNIPGYSGTFILDENYHPIILNNHNTLKIETIGLFATNYEFIITTPEGIKYYLGGNEKEVSAIVSGMRQNVVFSPTAFHLYKIQHPLYGEILFEYTTLSSRMYRLSRSYSERTNVYNRFGASTDGVIASTIKNQVQNQKFIKRIYNPDNNFEIRFEFTTYANSDCSVVLNNIVFKNENEVLKRVDFEYRAKLYENQQQNDFTTAKRFFLERLIINNNNGNKSEIYKMEYDDPEGLPERLTPSQDMYGYYNDNLVNSLIPKIELAIFESTNLFRANRYPNFQKAKKGTLTKITYPTGGYSIFEYEANPGKRKKFGNYFGDLTYAAGQLYASDSMLPRTEPDTGITIFNNAVYSSQTVSIFFNISSVDDTNYQTYHYAKAKMTIIDLETNEISEYIRSLGVIANGTTTTSNTSIEYHFVGGHHYQIQLSFMNCPQFISDLNTMFAFTLYEGDELCDGLGIRLKRQTNYSKYNTVDNIERYYYRTINTNELDTAAYVGPFLAKSENIEGEVMNSGYYDQYGQFVSYDEIKIYTMFYSNNGNGVLNTERIENYYNVVSISHGGDNFENGGTEKYFYHQHDIKNSKINVQNDSCLDSVITELGITNSPSLGNLFSMLKDSAQAYEFTDASHYNGTLITERFFSKKDGTLFLNREIGYQYSYELSQNKTNLVCKNLFPEDTVLIHCNSTCDDAGRNSIWNCLFAYYFNTQVIQRLNSINEKLYIDPIQNNLFVNPNQDYIDDPVIVIDDSAYKKIETTTTYTYGSLKGLPKTVTTTTSTGDSKQLINFYTNETNALTGLSQNQITSCNQKLANNELSNPIQTENFLNNVKLNTQRTLYKQLSPAKIVPDKIQTSKGSNPLEDRALFLEYDLKGNPTLISMKDGAKIKYLYNNNNQVIVKIENYIFDPENDIYILLDPVFYQVNFPNSFMTFYNYDPISGLLISSKDKNGKYTYYEYDSLYHLKYIKDNDNNIIQEFDNQYRPQPQN